METIRGKTSLDLDLNGFTARLTNYNRVILDLGTGDGKFAFHYARAFPNHFVIGVDACRENLHEHSRAKLPNLLFIIARAQDLPNELNGLVSHITINFPWGSLLESLLAGDSKLMYSLELISRSATSIDVRLNGGALAEQGWTLETGAAQIYDNLIYAGWRLKTPELINAHGLRDFPSTWAKRLAFGRDPRAIQLNGCVAGK
jgi:16S rRNA (adenine(1408)-N(1))-methyltransferase